MSDRCIGKRYYSNGGTIAAGDGYPHFNYHKDSDAAKPVIVIRESDIDERVRILRVCASGCSDEDLDSYREYCSAIRELEKLLPPKESEA